MKKLLLLIIPLMFALGYLMMVGITALILFILKKCGIDINISIWWIGLLGYVIWILLRSLIK